MGASIEYSASGVSLLTRHALCSEAIEYGGDALCTLELWRLQSAVAMEGSLPPALASQKIELEEAPLFVRQIQCEQIAGQRVLYRWQNDLLNGGSEKFHPSHLHSSTPGYIKFRKLENV